MSQRSGTFRDRTGSWDMFATVAVVAGAGLAGAIVALFSMGTDQILPYAAAVRFCDGHVPYRDFHVPYGYVSPLVLAPFVCLSPTGGWAILTASGVLNATAAWLACSIARVAVSSRTLPACAGAFMGVSFLLPFGAFYHDHLSYVFGLAAAYWLRPGTLNSREARWLAPVALALAYHTKQTVGLACVASLGAAILLSDRRSDYLSRVLLHVAAVYVAAIAVGVAAVAVGSDLSTFVRYAVETPARFGTLEEGRLLRTLLGFAFPFRLDPVSMLRDLGVGRLAFYPFVLAAYWCYWRIWRLSRSARDAGVESGKKQLQQYFVVYLLLSTLCSAGLIARLMWHCLLGLAPALALALAPQWPRWWAKTALCSLSALSVLGVLHLHRPDKHADPFFSSTALRPLRVKSGFSGMDIDAARATAQWLKTRPGPVAILDDRAQLVVLALGRVPQQPPLYFHNGLTVPSQPSDRAQWQREYVRSLEDRNVEYVVSALGASGGGFRTMLRQDVLSTLPILGAHLRARFAVTYATGHYQVFARR